MKCCKIIALFIIVLTFNNLAIGQYEDYEKPKLSGKYIFCGVKTYYASAVKDSFELGDFIPHHSRGEASFDRNQNILGFVYHPSFFNENIKVTIKYEYDENKILKKRYFTLRQVR
ncbi:hypothetical protein [Fulvivirga ligni]|uniref:hypothetical protein n=1 Tax=Fulvivirga ligni TaxID=2904246 RepID=UPI001F2F168A|nr:hypothetical protein [Fulvivirga ligni]UII23204.1 hypothetical protein LVD16_08185 [Fulvivirga ligni]